MLIVIATHGQLEQVLEEQLSLLTGQQSSLSTIVHGLDVSL